MNDEKNMPEYRSGDIVRVFYPYTPKALNEGDESPGKRRYGLVVNAGEDQAVALPIMAISTHSKQTRDPNYKLRDDEIRVPEGVSYFKRSIGKVEIDGVIKTERIEIFDDDEISRKLTAINLDTKIDVLERYKHSMNIPYYKNKMNEESPEHKEIMQKFENGIIAEKLQFLTTDLGNCRFEFMEDKKFNINKIQDLGKSDENKRVHYYAVELKSSDNKDSFFYTFSTMKGKNQIAKEWGAAKTGAEWLKEDERYYNLKRDLHKNFSEAPNPHPAKYKTFSTFKEKVLENNLER
ncbi:hypothetical protein BC30048_p2088 (plasmid) [Bacillus cereus]|uniref:hypothetical protein n=1 Tax=Bacillus cereus TaxID=1396 RepID=UPI001F26BF8B|nr:hypothetical protein [Bacillus cereus]BCC15075.1 hypothetical protein BCM0074_p1079 [Bacillus cereus]BCD02913.1 hypothetical protein BC30048_p2088 [Bacillus cereus]